MGTNDDRDRISYAIDNLAGCYGKLDDAVHERFGMTYERACWDSLEPLGYYIRELCAALDRPVPAGLEPEQVPR